MKILHVSLKNADARALRAAHYQRSQGHTVELLLGTVNAPTIEKVATRHALADGMIHGMPGHQINRPYIGQLNEQIDAFDPDVCHMHDWEAAFHVLCRINDLEARKRWRATYRIDRAEYPVVPPRRAALIFDHHEFEPGRALAWYSTRAIEERVGLTKQLLPHVHGNVAVSPAICDRMKQFYRLKTRPVFISNAPPRPRPLRGKDARAALEVPADEILVAFAGYASPDRQLDVLACAVGELHQRGVKVRPVVIGDPVPDYACEHQALLRNVGAKFIGGKAYPWPEIETLTLLDYVAACDVAFNGADTSWPNWKMSAPNKFFEYAFAGVPQCYAHDIVDVARWSQKYKLGVAHEHNPDSVAAAILQAAKPETKAAMRRDAFVDDYCYEKHDGPTLDTLYAEALASRAAQKGVA